MNPVTEIRWHALDEFALARHTESLDDDIAEAAKNEQLRRKAVASDRSVKPLIADEEVAS